MSSSPAASLTPAEFRALSQQVGHSPDRKLGSDATYEDQQATHRVTNEAEDDAYNRTRGQPGLQSQVLEHAHSRDNVTYSTHNKDHTARENRLAGESYTADDVEREGQRQAVSLGHLHKKSPAASAHTMAAARDAGPGFNETVADLDKRSFNSPAEKKSIDAAREEQKS